MIDSRIIKPICCLFAATMVALSQPPAPPAPAAPPAPPAPMAQAASAVAPVAPVPPIPPVVWEPFDQQLVNEKMLDLNEKMFDLKEKMKTDMDFKFAFKGPMALDLDLEERLAPMKAQMDLLAPKMAKMD